MLFFSNLAIFISSMLFATFFCSSFDQQICGGPGWSFFRGNCYKVFVGKMNHDQANKFCQSISSNLASIHSLEENTFIAEMATDNFDLCQKYCQPTETDKINISLYEPKSLEVSKFEMQPIFRSFWFGLHRVQLDKNQPVGPYKCFWDDGSECTFGNVPMSAKLADLGAQSAPNYPWSTGQPSGLGHWADGPPESCAHFWWKTGWWNDVLCTAEVSGAICKKTTKCL